MRIIFKAAILLVPVIMLVLPGCGSQGNTATTDPFAQSGAIPVPPGSATPTTTPVTSQDPAFSLTLNTDLASPTDISSLPRVDANIGTVLLSAELLNMSGAVFIDPVSKQPVAAGAPVPNQIVSFNVLAGPGNVVYTTPVTDKNGVAKGIFTTGNVNYTTNVIIEATTTVHGKNYRAYTSFQIVRGSGVIDMGKLGLLDAVEETVDATKTSGVIFTQQIVFKVTDSNGNPRVGVPVTLSVYSQQGDSEVVIDYLKNPGNEPNQQTVTSDSSGTGIFNVSVAVAAAPPGMRAADSIVYKAVTDDAIPVYAYVGGTYTVTSQP